MIKESDIMYSECFYCSTHVSAQDIYTNDNKEDALGSLLSIEGGRLEPIREVWQTCIKESDLPKDAKYSISEDEGFVFIQFNTLKEFLEFLNK